MATRIKPKRGTGAPPAGTGVNQLDVNEIAMDMAAGKLYVNNAGSIVVLAEKNATADDTYTDAQAIAAVEGEADLVLSGSLQAGGDIELDGNIIMDDGNDVLQVDGGALKLFHNGDLQLTTGQFETTFEVDVVSTGFFNISNGYGSRILREGAEYTDPALEVGSEGASVTDAVMDFALFDGGFGSSDRTATVARFNAYRGASDNNNLYVLVDDDGSQTTCWQYQVDGGSVINHAYGKFRVRDSGNGDIFVVEEDEPVKVITGSDAFATGLFRHKIGSGDDTHTMVKFDVDFDDQANRDVEFGFTAEVSGDNITGDDEGFCGRLDFEWKNNGNHQIVFRADNYENDVYHNRQSLKFSTSITEINTMLKLAAITMDTTANRPTGSAGNLYFNTTTKNLQLYTNAWQDISNQTGMIFCNASGVLHLYDGSDWKPFTMGAAI